MKKQVLSVIFLVSFILLGVANLEAQGIVDEYKEAIQKLKEKGQSEEDRQAYLKRSLTQALRNAMLRYHNYEDFLKITENDFKYEQAKDDAFTYYIKFNNYVGFFSFPNDPKLELSYPRSEKIILLPGKEPIKSEKKEVKENKK